MNIDDFLSHKTAMPEYLVGRAPAYPTWMIIEYTTKGCSPFDGTREAHSVEAWGGNGGETAILADEGPTFARDIIENFVKTRTSVATVDVWFDRCRINDEGYIDPIIEIA